ncbi:TonB-dependent receptor [Negadavirga shengliensis]|uniref:TonB-dependent receptor n=1 Tax=Negadavirga shengliensis TaxID=1389218 RepID=A0ABV9SZY9_9BACT
MIRKVVLILFLAGSPLMAALSQQTPGERGEIRDTEFIIRKDRVLTLPKQPRVFERTPSLPPVSSRENYSYSVQNFFVDLDPVKLDIQPFTKAFPREEAEQFSTFGKLGFGNYSSPLLQLRIHSLPDPDMNYGIDISHQGFYEGPVDGKNSAEDHSKVDLTGSLFRDNVEFFGKLGFHRDMYHFYGYTPIPAIEIVPEDIRQVFNTFRATAGLRKIERTESFDFDAALGLRLFADRYEASENEASIKAHAGFRANESLHGGIHSRLYFTSPSDITYSDINRNYFKLNPYIAFQQEGFKIRIGANVVQENDIVPNKNMDFHIFPEAFISYHFVPGFGIYGAYEGDVIRNTYYDFVMENPFLGPSAQLRNTIQNYQVDAGVTGAINGELTYKAGFKYGDFTNMHFYGNNVQDSTRFQLIYDDVTTVLQYHVNVGYNFDENYKLDASANYYQYTLSELAAPWHRPEWEINITNTFTPTKKWLINADFRAMGGIAAVNLASGTRDTLKPILDLNLGVDYSIHPQFSVFAAGNNLMNQRYERYWNYRVRGAQIIGGISFKF